MVLTKRETEKTMGRMARETVNLKSSYANVEDLSYDTVYIMADFAIWADAHSWARMMGRESYNDGRVLRVTEFDCKGQICRVTRYKNGEKQE